MDNFVFAINVRKKKNNKYVSSLVNINNIEYQAIKKTVDTSNQVKDSDLQSIVGFSDINPKNIVYESTNKDKMYELLKSSQKPTIFYIHGYNKWDKGANKQAIKLSKLHDINVVMFSWPSKPYSKKEYYFKIITNLRKLYLDKKHTLKMITNKIEKYKTSQQIAKKTKTHLEKILLEYTQNINTQQCNILLAHSMGNYLLLNTSELELLEKFDKVIFHEADIDEKTALSKINFLGKKAYITTNAESIALNMSEIANRNLISGKKIGDLLKLEETRLGNVVKQESATSPNYIDLTKEASVFNAGGGHTLFLSKDQEIKNKFDSVFRC